MTRFAAMLVFLLTFAAAALADPVPTTTSLITPAARAEQQALCAAGGAFPTQWAWDAGQTVSRPRAAKVSDALVPKIEQYRGGNLIATWRSFGSDPATCDFGNPSATQPVDLAAAAASGCGPFGNYSHVDLWNILEPGDKFLVYPAVYTGRANNIVLIDKPEYWTGPVRTPSNIMIAGVTQRGIRPLIYRNDDGQGDFATSQGAIYVASARNILLQNMDVELGASGSVGKAGIYINGARNLTLRDMRIHEFAWQASGTDGQNGVFATSNTSGILTLHQIEAFNNGGPIGPTHNFYINASALDPTFKVRFLQSWSHDAVYGHTFKSRAQVNEIEGNYFQGGLPNTVRGQTQAENYLLDLPNGGVAVIRNNIFVKNASGPNSNGMSITYAMEGIEDARRQSISIRNNTFVALTRLYDGFHQVYPLSFFYPNIVPGAAAWPAAVAHDIRHNAFVGYCPADPIYLRSGNYRGLLSVTEAFSELKRDFSLTRKYAPAGDLSIVGTKTYAHESRAGPNRAAATIGARD
ncbi:MAG: hypothetical protein ACKVP5_14230 [Aestuariivirga sp.]